MLSDSHRRRHFRVPASSRPIGGLPASLSAGERLQALIVPPSARQRGHQRDRESPTALTEARGDVPRPAAPTRGEGKRPPTGRRPSCQSASNFGSNSLLMNLRRRCGLFREGIRAMPSFRASELLPTGFCAVGALSQGGAPSLNPSDEREQRAAPIMRRAVFFGLGTRDPHPCCLVDSPIAGRRAAPTLQARRFGCVAVLRRAAHLYRTLPLQHPQALGASHALDSIRSSIVQRWPLEVGRRRVSHFAGASRSVTTPCCAPCADGAVPELRGPVIVGIYYWAWR